MKVRITNQISMYIEQKVTIQHIKRNTTKTRRWRMKIILNPKGAEDEFPMTNLLEGTGRPVAILANIKIVTDKEIKIGESLIVDDEAILG